MGSRLCRLSSTNCGSRIDAFRERPSAPWTPTCRCALPFQVYRRSLRSWPTSGQLSCLSAKSIADLASQPQISLKELRLWSQPPNFRALVETPRSRCAVGMHARCIPDTVIQFSTKQNIKIKVKIKTWHNITTHSCCLWCDKQQSVEPLHHDPLFLHRKVGICLFCTMGLRETTMLLSTPVFCQCFYLRRCLST